MFNLGIISAGGNFTRVVFDYQTSAYNAYLTKGALEAGTGSTGGSKVSGYFSDTRAGWQTASADLDLTSLNILWANRYNYRIGGSNVYSISNIRLYNNGVLVETQSGTTIIGSANFSHAGINLNPSSRTTSYVLTGLTTVPYPK